MDFTRIMLKGSSLIATRDFVGSWDSKEQWHDESQCVHIVDHSGKHYLIRSISVKVSVTELKWDGSAWEETMSLAGPSFSWSALVRTQNKDKSWTKKVIVLSNEEVTTGMIEACFDNYKSKIERQAAELLQQQLSFGFAVLRSYLFPSFPSDNNTEPAKHQEIICEECGGIDCHLDGCGAEKFDVIEIKCDPNGEFGNSYSARLVVHPVADKFQANGVEVTTFVERE